MTAKITEKYTTVSIYFALLGIITLAFGIADLVVVFGGNSFRRGILGIPGDPFRGGWGGLIILFAGIFYLSSIHNFYEIHQFSKAVMGSILVWIVAGCDIFVMITESIPGEEGWFNTLEGFLETYGPPYPPALILLPFSLLMIYCIYLRKKRKS